MKRAAQIVLGIVMIAVLFAWLIVRHKNLSTSEQIGALLSVGPSKVLQCSVFSAVPHSSRSHGRTDGGEGLTGDPEMGE